MPSNGPTPWCSLAQQMTLQLLSTLSMMLTASGKHSHRNLAWSSTTIQIQKSIANNIFSRAKLFEAALLYIECQLCVCQSDQLSLSLRKSHIFPKQLKFVGIEICLDENCPAMSKHQLLKHWPQPKIIHEVSKNCWFCTALQQVHSSVWTLHFPTLQFNHQFCYTEPVTPRWTTAAQELFEDIKQAILLNSCLQRFNF